MKAPVIRVKTEEGATYNEIYASTSFTLTTELLIQAVQMKCLLPKHLEQIKGKIQGFTLTYCARLQFGIHQLSPRINAAGGPHSYKEIFNKNFLKLKVNIRMGVNCFLEGFPQDPPDFLKTANIVAFRQ